MTRVYIVIVISILSLISCLESQNGGTGSSSSTISPQTICGAVDKTSPGFDCNGRSISYPSDQFVFRSLDTPHSILNDSQLDSVNNILVCSSVGVSVCEQICVNQAFNFRHRYGLLYTGYIWPNSQCAYYIFQHNDESGLVKFEYFEGFYQGIGNSAVGRCTNTNLSMPKSQGYYSFTETRVPEGQISPAPDRSRLYYSLEFMDLNQQPNGGYILPNYDPIFGSNVIISFDRPFGNISVSFHQLAGFACVKRNEIIPAVIDLIR